jgi:5-methylthioadenosine/S-adenosylhomocysteine deaminase
MTARELFLLACAVCAPGRAFPQAPTVTVSVGTDSTKQVIRGTVVTPDTVLSGEVVIDADTIVCVAPDCSDPPGASVFRVAGGYIYPGFIDAHNHVAYNVLPKWTPPKLYVNRGQWQRAKAYKAFKAPYNQLKDRQHLFCEMVKWGELKALISGITAVQGTSPPSTCIRTLIRNVENQNELGTRRSYIRTFILDIRSFHDTVDWNVTRSFVVHLAEGLPTDSATRREFQTLKQKGLLRPETAIIHGMALGDAEFAEMGAVGAKLIWSPQSNRVLYGRTTDIRSALAHGVSVSLGVDWNPSGSDDLFGELRVAAQVNEEQFDGVIHDADWIKLITVNPAKALALDALIGRLAPGFKADITVLRKRGDDPSRSLLENHPEDVEMVWVGGKLLYGRASVLQKVRPDRCEAVVVNGTKKRICVVDTTDPVDKSHQSLAEIRAILLGKYPQLSPLAR